MLWSDFYDHYWDWADSTRRTRISTLEDIGSGDEVVEVALDIEDEKVRAQLIRKAMALGVQITNENYTDLDGELPDELYAQLAQYAGIDPENPYFNEDDMEWEDFYDGYIDWDEATCARRVRKLRRFGDSAEVSEAISMMPNTTLEKLLYHKAVASGVKFTRNDMLTMGRWDEVFEDVIENDLSDEKIDQFVAKAESKVKTYEQMQRREKRIGFWAVLGAIFSAFSKGNGHKDPRYCDGNCANCPPHYGYRYGRWYYGHGHMHGCVRNGNGGASGRTYRD